MSIFGWRLTNKQPKIESEEIKSLHKLLREEKLERLKQAVDAAKKAKAYKVELAKSKAEEEKRKAKLIKTNKRQAIAHLKAAERYYEGMVQSTGARHDELKAIVSARLEKAKGLGFNVTGNITKTINELS